MKPHKWAKEIKAWADGAEIEAKFNKWDGWSDWELQKGGFVWFEKEAEYRIKPQPKEPQYLYVYQLGFEYKLASAKEVTMKFQSGDRPYEFNYIGKIKLEVDDAD